MHLISVLLNTQKIFIFFLILLYNLKSSETCLLHMLCYHYRINYCDGDNAREEDGGKGARLRKWNLVCSL